MKKKLFIGCLVSGGGTNLQAIIDSCSSSAIHGEVVFVGSDNPGAFGLTRAKNHGIPTFIVDYNNIIRRFHENPEEIVVPNDFSFDDIYAKQSIFSGDMPKKKIGQFLTSRVVAEAELLNQMNGYDFDLLVLAGFMRILTPYFIDRINTVKEKPRIMNIHPALLPAFPGTDGYGDTYRYGCKIGGCTVHFVDYGEDSGPIIAQRSFPIHEDDTLERIKERGIKLEWELYPECIRWFAENRLQVIKRSHSSVDGKKTVKTVVKILSPAL